ncbi:MAG TPA: signal peptidase I [Terracidiphilus sp.]|nr:signal peptidase I [Terracidiphilus sp.]
MPQENENLTEPSAQAAEAGGQAVQADAGQNQRALAMQNQNNFGLWVRDLAIATAISVFMVMFLYQPVRVEGTSMLPGLENRDRLFINKYVYHLSSIQRGDVVVFHYPADPEKSYIKRVIALPGDTIRIDRGQVWVNGQALSEPYVPVRFRDTRNMDAMVVPKGRYFVMGDHRSISFDSRDFGTVKRNLIYGKAEFVYWPAKDAGVVH